MDQRIPEPIRPLLQDYLSRVTQGMPGLLNAFFVEGSIALGGFSQRFSDIDFVAGLNRPATSAEIGGLRDIHKAIAKKHPRWKLSGSYLELSSLGRLDGVVPALYYHDGALRLDGHFELNSVEGWILKHYGIALLGPAPQDLALSVDWEALIQWMRGNLNSYWLGWTRRPDCLVLLLTDWGIQWAVLGVLRQFYSFRENTITTKTKAAEYALTCVPARWHRLIREALRIREQEPGPAYRFRLARAIETVDFLKYVIQTCNADFS